MRIAVVVPSYSDFYSSPERFSALGARTVAALFEARGHHAELVILPELARSPVSLPLPAPLAHLRSVIIPGERGPTSYFTTFRRFGPDAEESSRIVAARNPDAILISSFAYAYAEPAVELARACRTVLPRVPIVVGGAGPSAAPWYFLENDSLFDVVAGGEVEVVADELEAAITRAAEARRAGKRPSTLHLVADRNASASQIVPVVATRVGTGAGKLHLTTSLSRGCPKRCAFCSNHLCHGREFRTADTAGVIKALEAAAAPGSGIEHAHVNFEDDNLLYAREAFFEVLDAARRIFGRLSISAENGLDYVLLTPHLVDRLAGYGFDRFNLSMASSDGSLTRRYGRSGSLDRLDTVLEAFARHGIPGVTYFICGLAGDTATRAVDDLRVLRERPTACGISLFYPVPGLPGFESRRDFAGKPPILAAGSSAWPWTGSMSTVSMVTLFRLSRLTNFLSASPRLETEPTGELRRKTLSERRLFTIVGRGGRARVVPVPVVDEAAVSRYFS